MAKLSPTLSFRLRPSPVRAGPGKARGGLSRWPRSGASNGTKCPIPGGARGLVIHEGLAEVVVQAEGMTGSNSPERSPWAGGSGIPPGGGRLGLPARGASPIVGDAGLHRAGLGVRVDDRLELAPPQAIQQGEEVIGQHAGRVPSAGGRSGLSESPNPRKSGAMTSATSARGIRTRRPSYHKPERGH